MVTVRDGKSCFLWHDLWDGIICSQVFPELFSFTKNQHISVFMAVTSGPFHDQFHLPLSPEAYAQYLDLELLMQELHLQNDTDTQSYIWGSSTFSSRKTYKQLIRHRQIHPSFGWLWKSSCQNKRKFFFWLVLQERLNTGGLLKRKNMSLQDYSCVLCACGIEEDLSHLLFHCPFSLACWDTLHLAVPDTSHPSTIVESFKVQLQLPFFTEIIITMCWCIWMMRNDIIFSNISHSVQRCRSVLRKEFALVILRSETKLHPQIDLWLEDYV